MSKKKKIDNVYVIRKMVKADSIAEALKKEKRAAIGFNYSTIDEDDE